MEFKDLKLSEQALEKLKAVGFVAPTEIQQLCIPQIMEGKDLVGLSQTGSGKTLAFGLPLLEKTDQNMDGVQAIVVSPTRELAIQTTTELKKFAPNFVKVVPVYGGADMSRQIKALKNASVVVGTPGRMIDHIGRRTLKLAGVKMVVLDEADEMLDMGFREDIEKILKSTMKTRQTIMFSATMPKGILELTKNYMQNPHKVDVARNEKAGKTNQFFVKISKNEKIDAIKSLIDTLKPRLTLIFCNTKHMVDKLADKLDELGFGVGALHGDKRQSERKKVMDAFKSGERSILIATDVAARGIDVKNVDCVLNYDVPKEMDYYVHRIGRTGRAASVGNAFNLVVNDFEMQALKGVEKEMNQEIKEFKIEGLGLKVDRDFDSKKEFKKPSGRRPERFERTKRNFKNSDRFDKKPFGRSERNFSKGRGFATKSFEKADSFERKAENNSETSTFKKPERRSFERTEARGFEKRSHEKPERKGFDKNEKREYSSSKERSFKSEGRRDFKKFDKDNSFDRKESDERSFKKRFDKKFDERKSEFGKERKTNFFKKDKDFSKKDNEFGKKEFKKRDFERKDKFEKSDSFKKFKRNDFEFKDERRIRSGEARKRDFGFKSSRRGEGKPEFSEKKEFSTERKSRPRFQKTGERSTHSTQRRWAPRNK